MSHKRHYSRFLAGLGGKLHFAAHSHHPWPDCTREAHVQAWDDAAAQIDDKWTRVFGRLVPAAQKSVAANIGWPDPSLVAFAPNTHEFVVRLFSCLPSRKLRILTTDAEFHSFAREAARLEEEGTAVERVPVEPIESFAARFCEAERKGGWDLIFLSQVFFNSGLRVRDEEFAAIAEAAPQDAILAFDGYHAFMAVPMDLSRSAGRAFYMAGGYKYAQAGEGACFLAVPPGCELRPANTGWFSDMASLEKGLKAPVSYGAGAFRFWGSTFDQAGLYRWNAVSEWREKNGLPVKVSDAHVRALQRGFLERLKRRPCGPLKTESLISTDLTRVGHFLTFRLPDAPALAKRLHAELEVMTDARGDRLRFGFGLYHDESDLDELFSRLKTLNS